MNAVRRTLVAAMSALTLSCVNKATNVEGGDTIVQRQDSDAGPSEGTASGSASMGARDDGAPAPDASSSTPASGGEPTEEGSDLESEIEAPNGEVPTVVDETADDVAAETGDDVADETDDVGSDAPSADPGEGSEDVDDDALPGEMGSDGAGDDTESPEEAPPDGSREAGADPRDTSPDVDAGSSDEQQPAGGGVPMGVHCAPVADWEPAWAQFESEVVLLVNEARAAGTACGEDEGVAPVGALAMDEALTCAARLHSLDMHERQFYDHQYPEEGPDTFERIQDAGYSFREAAENIAMDYESPEEVVAAWMATPELCGNVMSTGITVIGVGYHPGAPPGYEHLVTADFAAPGGGF